VNLRDFAQAGEELVGRGVVDAAVLHKESEMPVARVILDPAEAVAVVFEVVRPDGAELVADEFFDFSAEGVESHRFDRVLETGIGADVAVAVVTLHADNGLGHGHGLLGGAEAHDVGETGKGLFVAMGHAHAATDGDVVADDLVVFDDGDKAEVVGEDVDVIARGNGDDGLELARQVVLAVDGLFGIGDVVDLRRIVGDLDLFAGAVVEPDLVIGAGAGAEVVRDLGGEFEHVGVDLRLMRVRIAHHVAIHITAGGESVEEGLVDLGDGLFEIALDDAVELESLPGRELERSVGMLESDAVHLEPLHRRGDAAGDADADHERVGGLELLLAALFADVAVVLLVDAVKLGELLIVLRDGSGRRVGESFEDGAAQVIARVFDAFVR